MTEKQKNPSFRSDTFSTPQDRPWRIAHVHLHEKRTKRPNGKPIDNPHFSAVLLAPKLGAPDVCPNYRLLQNAIMQAVGRANWGSWPQGGHWPIQDGDVPFAPKAAAPGQPAVAYDPKKYEYRKGHWIIEVTNYFASGPTVAILQNGQIVPLPAQKFNGHTWYKSGDHVVGSIHAYTFNNEKFGANFGFDGVLFVGPGEAIGGGPKSAQEMFAGVQAPAGMAPMAPSGPALNGPPPHTAAPAGPAYAAPGGPPMPPGAAPGPAVAPAYAAPAPGGPIQTVTLPGPSYAAPGPVGGGPAAPAPMLPPMPPGVAAAPALPAFPPR